MWFFTLLMNAYNAFVVWTIERKHYSELKGSTLDQTGTFLWVPFSSLFSLHGKFCFFQLYYCHAIHGHDIIHPQLFANYLFYAKMDTPS